MQSKSMMDMTLELMQQRLIASVLRAPAMADVAEMSRRMAETAGIVAGTMIARRVKDCCETCATPEGIAVTMHDILHTFKSNLEEAARETAKSIGTDEVAVYKAIQLLNNPTAELKDVLGIKDPQAVQRKYFDIVLSDNNEFLDIEDEHGKSFAAGERVQRHDGYTVLRIRPEVFGLEISTVEETDPIADSIGRAFADLLGADVHVVTAASPIEVILRAKKIDVSAETLIALNQASAHHRTCRCDTCLLWWAYAGPEHGTRDPYGPFTKEEVNAKQTELKVRVTS